MRTRSIRGPTVGALAAMVDEGSRNPEEKSFTSWGRSWWCRPLRGMIQLVFVFPLLRWLYRLKVVGAPNIAGLQGPVLFAANHCLRTDNGLLLKALPANHRRRLAIAAWEELWQNPLYRVTHPLLGNGFPFSKQGSVRASLENLGRVLDDRWSVLIYPEGELTVGGPNAAVPRRDRAGGGGVRHSGRAAEATHSLDWRADIVPDAPPGRRGGAVRFAADVSARHVLRPGDGDDRAGGEGAVGGPNPRPLPWQGRGRGLGRGEAGVWTQTAYRGRYARLNWWRGCRPGRGGGWRS